MIIQNQLLSLRMFMFFVSAIGSMVVSFLPIYFQHKGFLSSQIGWFLAIGPFVGLIAQPLWGYASDKYKTVKRVLFACLVGFLLSVIWIFQIDSFLWIITAGIFFFFFFSPLHPLADNLAKRQAQIHSVTFGSIRMWGSIGFAIVSLVSGFLLTEFGIGFLVIPVTVFTVITCFLALLLSDTKAGTKKVNYKDIGVLFKDPTLLVFFFLTALVLLTHRTSDSFISLYLFEIGGNEMLVGWIWFIGVSSEALLFFLSAKWFRASSPIFYIIIASFLYCIRWVLTAFAQDPTTLLMIQVLHGICFAIVFLGALEYLYKAIPEELQATGHMVFVGITFGITGIVGSSIGGVVFENYGGKLLYLLLAISSFIGFIGFILFYLKEKKTGSNKVNIPIN
ncbi:MFS family permease [Metabacillus crassostreae]|uniref:MFS transporter n=1 Tax=Metabacillus crassostreae TaxID=929098 RepID=UPI00195DA8BE|nr:MFS transporter [Metabacillus crassostreae]MBM7603771.1 MFS family permease [Metabacillus crassostreae]